MKIEGLMKDAMRLLVVLFAFLFLWLFMLWAREVFGEDVKTAPKFEAFLKFDFVTFDPKVPNHIHNEAFRPTCPPKMGPAVDAGQCCPENSAKRKNGLLVCKEEKQAKAGCDYRGPYPQIHDYQIDKEGVTFFWYKMTEASRCLCKAGLCWTEKTKENKNEK